MSSAQTTAFGTVESSPKLKELVQHEKRLNLLSKDPDCPVHTLEDLVRRLQENHVNLIFADYMQTHQLGLEDRMWTVHHRIIERYRQQMTQDKHDRKHPVELRKMQGAFNNFIKQVTRFYRSLIQRLVSHFMIHELEWVVYKFNLPVSEPDVVMDYGSPLKELVIESCHRTLVYLGDLSRYRETPKTPKNWGPAIGYYTLAKELLPSYGAPHNQLAVIAINEGSTFSATYHLYRAVSAQVPYPESSNNLKLGFRKALQRDEDYLVSSVRKEEQAVKELITSFIRLHTRCYNGKEFTEYESSESEMLTQLALDLKERNLSNGMLTKLVLINIAAQAYATKRTKRPRLPSHHASFIRLNIATFTTLHQVFQPELERATDARVLNDIENISAVGRRMLPSLRLYSMWLRMNHRMLANEGTETAISVLIKQLWQTYANTLSLLAATFALDELPQLSYPLEEDKEAIGFQPFELEMRQTDYREWQGPQAAQISPAHPNEEILTRVRFLLEDGLSLCQKEDVPLTMVGGTVTYKEDGIVTSTPSIGMNSSLNLTSGDSSEFLLSKNVGYPPHADSVLGQAGTSIVDSVAGSESTMNRMVDSLVGPREQPSSEDGMET